ncbi:MAG TPA: GNAT family protein [Caulobacteraceae bacterium]|nr:GNAT family protein [Caulobacteraceae bacterium]
MFAPIETERLRLRPIAADDWRAIHAYMSDPQVTAWLPEGLLDEAAAQAFAARNADEDATDVAVIERASGQLIGHMAFHPWFGAGTHEVGWAFRRDRWGRGYATEAAKALMAHAFEILGCHRFIATCQPENPASWRIMEKLGMRREAHFRSALHRGGDIWWDEYFYAILAEEYFAKR